MAKQFPSAQPNEFYITEGGIETEIMYKWGFELPHFAMFPLLEDSNARAALTSMYKRYFDVVAKYKRSALVGGFDYRASPDWGLKLGYDKASLKEANLASIEFLREVGKAYANDIPNQKFVGYVGPRGDAYRSDGSMSSDAAKDYHSVQIATLKEADVDLVWAVTFSGISEAVGAVEAAKEQGLPIAVSFTLNSAHRLNSGFSLEEAIHHVDLLTENYPSFYSLNCSHPMEFGPALNGKAWTKRLRSIRPNAAKMDKIALCQLGHLEEGDPVELGQLMNEIRVEYPHMDIWGGCCGTCDVHLEEIVKHLC